MLAAIIVSAIGLSCAGCLGTSGLQTAPSVQSHAQIEDTGQDHLVRLGPSPEQTFVSPRAPQQQQLTQIYIPGQSVNARPAYEPAYSGNTHQPVHPQGRKSGIDIAVAEFAQSNSSQSSSPIRHDQQWLPRDEKRIDADYTFVANRDQTGFGLDLALQPRVSIQTDAGVRTTRAGAEVRVGQNLDLRGQDAKNSNWYFFAGADGEAVVWDVNLNGTLLADSPVSLQDKVTIGDMQAGVAWESPAGQMSFSYIEREYEYRNGAISRSGEENFVAVTLSWRQ